VTEQQPERSAPELRDYVRILSLRKWTAIFVALIVVGGVMYLSFQQRRVYQSEARVLPVAATNGVSSTGQPLQGKVDLATEAVVAESDAVAALAAAQPGLGLPVNSSNVQKLLRQISVAPYKSGSILIFQGVGGSAEEALNVTKAFADAYLEYRRNQNVTSLMVNSKTFATRIQDLHTEIAALGPPSSYTAVEASQAPPLEAELATAIASKAQYDTAIQAIKGSSGAILKEPQLPSKPIRPNHIRDAILAVIVGLVLGFAAAFARDYVDDSLRGVEDVERQSGATLVGVIPHVPGASDGGKRKEKDGERTDAAFLVAEEDSKAPATEAYRTLRTNLLFMAATGPLKVLTITSPLQGEGKSTTAANLGAVLAQAGQRVLLVGADLRRPTVHRFFNLSNRIGLSGVLSGQAELTEAVQDPGITGLRVITSGPVPPNPAELLGSPRMKQFLVEVSKVADWVLLDGPPVLGLADALVLSSLADGTIMVVNEATNRRILAHARDQLGKVQTRTVGAVLNNFGPTFSYYYSDYYMYSGYYQEASKEAEPSADKISRRERKRRAKSVVDPTGFVPAPNGTAPMGSDENGAAEGSSTPTSGAPADTPVTVDDFFS
jgi:succinoglycan biosynthesis transport protein ExoP